MDPCGGGAVVDNLGVHGEDGDGVALVAPPPRCAVRCRRRPALQPNARGPVVRPARVGAPPSLRRGRGVRAW
eukprot:2641407-Pyramimonas_sp.AAC.1